MKLTLKRNFKGSYENKNLKLVVRKDVDGWYASSEFQFLDDNINGYSASVYNFSTKRQLVSHVNGVLKSLVVA